MNSQNEKAFVMLEQSVLAALDIYSNVHRGSGHKSIASTRLFEQARDIVLEYLGLKKRKYTVVFCTLRRAEAFKAQLDGADWRCVSSQDVGLPLGVWALAIENKKVSKLTRFETGGGTARLVSPGWIVQAKAPARFEAGTPAIVNVIAFARALQLIQKLKSAVFKEAAVEEQTAADILYRDELVNYAGQELLDKFRQTAIGHAVMVPTRQGLKPYIDLDNGASTPTFKPIADAACHTWKLKESARQEIVREVCNICSGYLSAPASSYDMVFTSNTTEAINLVAKSLGRGDGSGNQPVVLDTLLEHNSNDLPWRKIPGGTLIRLGIDAEGFVDLKELEETLAEYNQTNQHGDKRIKLVAVSGASNVLGVFNDIAAIGRIVHRYGARLLVDAAQLVAHRKVEMDKSNIDYLVFSGHKMYAPFGSGVLAAKKGLLNFSNTEWDLIRTSGEQNAAGIAALGKAMLILQRIGLDLIQREEQVLTARALRGLAQIPGLRVFGITDTDSASFAYKGGVIAFEIKNMMASRIAKELAERGAIGIRWGCHCAHMLIKHLYKLGPRLQFLQKIIVTVLPSMELPGMARVSLGIENDEADIDILIRTLDEVARRAPLPHVDIKQQIEQFAQAVAQKIYAG